MIRLLAFEPLRKINQAIRRAKAGHHHQPEQWKKKKNTK